METATGKLFYFYKDPYRKVPIFMSGDSNRCLLWIGGQAESFLTICYFPELIEKLGGSWNFTQIEIPSSHVGFGGQDHLTEAADIVDIIDLLNCDYGMEEITLFTTSTGLQIALEVLKNQNAASIISRFIVHGVVCPVDNQYFTPAAVQKRQERVAELMKEGRREDSQAMVGYYDIPITAARLSEGGFPSLQEALWQPALEGDYAKVKEAFGHIKIPTMIMCAKDYNYRPGPEDFEKANEAAKQAIESPLLSVEFFGDTCDEVRRLLKADIPHHVSAIAKFLNDCDDARRADAAKEEALAAEEAKRKRNEANKKRYSCIEA
eukprot:gene11022-7658_t